MSKAAAAITPDGVGHIAIVRTDHIGDAVMTIPLLRETRRLFPQARIDLVLSASARALFEVCPYVDRVIPVKPRAWRRADSLHQLFRVWRLRRTYFLGMRPDLVLSPRRGPEADGTALIAWAIRAKEGLAFRKGKHYRPLSAFIHDWCFSRLLDPVPPEHEVCSNLRLLEALGADKEPFDDRLELWLQPQAKAQAASLLGSVGVGEGEKFIVLSPGAASSGRNKWPADRFAAVAQSVYRQAGVRSLLVGTEGECPLAARIVALAGGAVINVCGQTSLPVLAALLARATLFVGNDSGTGHIAAAVGTQTVTISSFPVGGDPAHPNSVVRFRPYGRDNIVIQPERPASDDCTNGCCKSVAHCILDVAADQVEKAVLGIVGT